MRRNSHRGARIRERTGEQRTAKCREKNGKEESGRRREEGRRLNRKRAKDPTIWRSRDEAVVNKASHEGKHSSYTSSETMKMTGAAQRRTEQ